MTAEQRHQDLLSVDEGPANSENAESEGPGESGDSGEHQDIFPTTYHTAQDAADVAALAEAERAVARHGATPEQLDGVAEAARFDRAEDRLEGWRRR